MVFFASLLLIEIIILKYIYFARSDNETFKKNESVKFLAIFSNFHEICKKLYMKKKDSIIRHDLVICASNASVSSLAKSYLPD